MPLPAVVILLVPVERLEQPRLWAQLPPSPCQLVVPGASREMLPAATGTILTWLGRCCENSLPRNLLSGLGPAESPRSCCMRQTHCKGCLSPSFSEVEAAGATIVLIASSAS